MDVPPLLPVRPQDLADPVIPLVVAPPPLPLPLPASDLSVALPPPLPRAFARDSAIISAFAFYGGLLLVSLIALILATFQVLSKANLILSLDVVDSLVVICWAVASFSLLRPALLNPGRPIHYLVALILGGFTFCVASAVVKTVTFLLPIPVIYLVKPFTDQGYGLPIVLLSVCLQPAVIEELAFRGLLFESLRTPFGLMAAALVSAGFFALLHLSSISFPHLLLLGLILVWLRHWSGSLYPCIVLHFTHNFLCVISEMS